MALVVKNAYQCRRCKGWGFDSWVRNIPWRRAQQPTPVFLPEKFHGQRSLAGYSPGAAKSWIRLSNWAHNMILSIFSSNSYLKKKNRPCLEIILDALCPSNDFWKSEMMLGYLGWQTNLSSLDLSTPLSALEESRSQNNFRETDSELKCKCVYWGAWVLRMRLEAHHLCTLVPNQISETRVLGGVGKDSFITLPGEEGTQWASALREEVSLCGEDSEKVYSIGSKRVWSALGHSEALVVR